MKARDIVKMVKVGIETGQSLLLVGPPGVGKTFVVKQAVAEYDREHRISGDDTSGADLVILHPAISDPTDFKGFPANVDGEAKFLPFGDLLQLLNCKRKTICFIDDLGQALPAVQNAVMQLIWGGQLNGHKLSESVIFMAATNRKQDRANVMGISEPVKSRFSSIVEFHVDVDEWIAWASTSGISPVMIAFIKWAPDMLFQHAPTLDIVNMPCPRTVANADGFLRGQGKHGYPDTILYELIKGAAGEEFAAKLLGFIKIYRNLPDIDVIIADPDNAPVPEGEGAVLYAIAAALAHRAKKDNFDNIIRYLKRIPDEFAVFSILSATKRDNKLMSSRGFIAWATDNAHILID